MFYGNDSPEKTSITSYYHAIEIILNLRFDRYIKEEALHATIRVTGSITGASYKRSWDNPNSVLEATVDTSLEAPPLGTSLSPLQVLAPP